MGGVMATGPEHYREAERLLAIVDADQAADTMLTENALIRMAQVHATLALAAASALGSMRVDDHGMFGVDIDSWIHVASEEDLGDGEPLGSEQ